jgi:hypothetical protein
MVLLLVHVAVPELFRPLKSSEIGVPRLEMVTAPGTCAAVDPSCAIANARSRAPVAAASRRTIT